ncbi:hypothetical protein E4K67_21260 [Desulfosporosinus fructosivorans]|uniref:Uncharacterized protein n=1 Tax=Desulfosporosinus fructosivorans TaxID=2018669 RepID=A0A4Z0R245_9FIRM|nr:hypothetical protein [Desulfosporosinus fructosivorans]TGE36067.1 hypothetical protein E4K67_21260 [Desulfosporosinus fructosivorans]
MSNLTVICYLSSLLSYGMGFLQTLAIKDGVTEHVATFDTFHVSVATGYFVLAIFLAVIGSLFFYAKLSREQERTKIIKRSSKEELLSA